MLNMRGHIFKVTSKAAQVCRYSKSRWLDPCVQTLTISLMPKIPLKGYTGASAEEIKFPGPVQNEVHLGHAVVVLCLFLVLFVKFSVVV